MATIPCPECGKEIPERGGGWCPFCQRDTFKVGLLKRGGWGHPVAAGGRDWSSSTFLTAGIVAGVVSGLMAGYYNSRPDLSVLLVLSSIAGVLSLIWLLIGAVARGVAVGMREHEDGS